MLSEAILDRVTPCHCAGARRITLVLTSALLVFAALVHASPLLAGELRQVESRIHVVEAGETLSEIAKGYGIPTDELMRLNGIANANAIYVGQTLRLPVRDSGKLEGARATQSTATDSEASELNTTDKATEGVNEPVRDEEGTIDRQDNPIATLNRAYTVRPGDTLAAIALRNGVDKRALRLLNNLEAGIGLVSGYELLLPAAGDDLVVKHTIQDYIVVPGDSIIAIARAFDVSLPALLQANHIADPNAIRIGQRLIIPKEPVEISGDQMHREEVGPPESGFFYYTVQPGDTLSEIARDFATPILALLEYNDLPNEETVYTGLELQVPFGPPPLPQHPLRVPSSGTSFLVSLSRQQCWVFQGERVLHSWNCSTGYGEWITRTGSFQVQTKLENAKSGAYRLDMPYWLGIYDVGEYENGIHGLPVSWESGEKLWDSLVGQPATFGCAMLGDEDAEALFNLAYLGMPVHIVQ